jgi:hypothetical protein
VLCGLYLWRDATPHERVRLVVLAVAAPVIWALTDLIVTGDPLHSLHGTANLAEEVGRRRKVTQVPRWTAQYVGFTLREPLILGVPVGLVFAWRHRRPATPPPPPRCRSPSSWRCSRSSRSDRSSGCR